MTGLHERRTPNHRVNNLYRRCWNNRLQTGTERVDGKYKAVKTPGVGLKKCANRKTQYIMQIDHGAAIRAVNDFRRVDRLQAAARVLIAVGETATATPGGTKNKHTQNTPNTTPPNKLNLSTSNGLRGLGVLVCRLGPVEGGPMRIQHSPRNKFFTVWPHTADT